MQEKAVQDLYIGYNDVMYRLNGRNGSVIWRHPLQQPSKMNRIIGSSMQVHINERYAHLCCAGAMVRNSGIMRLYSRRQYPEFSCIDFLDFCRDRNQNLE